MASVSKRTWTHKGVTKSAWAVRYVDGAGVHRQKTFELKKPADACRRQVEDEIEKGLHIASSQSVTVAALIDQYLDAASARMRDGQRMSRGHYTTVSINLTKHVLPVIGSIRLLDLSYRHVDDLRVALAKKPSLSPHSVRRILHVLKVAIDWAIPRGYVNRNVVPQVMKDNPSGPKTKIRVFDRDEVAKILAEVAVRPANSQDRTTQLVRCAILLAAFCGLRYGEVMGLTWANLDFDDNVIQVRHSLTHWDELKGPKTLAGRRDVPMPSIVSEALADWRRFATDAPRGLVFRLKTGAPIGVQNFHQNYWKPVLERAGLAPGECAEIAKLTPTARVRFRRGDWPHFHALRHFYASMLIAGGMPLTDTAAMMGHSSFDMTLQVYAHPTTDNSHRHKNVAALVQAVIPAFARAPDAQGILSGGNP